MIFEILASEDALKNFESEEVHSKLFIDGLIILAWEIC